jgi:hypothetical protein
MKMKPMTIEDNGKEVTLHCPASGVAAGVWPEGHEPAEVP